MKATELMIGDWVNFHRSPFVKNGIYYDKIILLDKYDVECEPIPLTAEILEKNGFGSENILGDRSSVPFLMQVYDENHIVMYQKLFEYVHELQQALRLCGLTELADNIKL